MNKVTPHPDPETLVRFVDDDLSPADSELIRDHSLFCGDCHDRLQTLRQALDDYARFHSEILKRAIPPPPRAWGRLELPEAKSTRWWPMGWLAAAAAIAAVVLLMQRFEHAPAVRAAELLRKAAAAEQASSPSHARIRIRSKRHTLDRDARLAGRPAGVENADAAALHALFDAAGYRWDDPVSAAAFARWRDRLREKQDQIDQTTGTFLVRTSSAAGALSDAALTLRSADLHAVACTLRFRSGGETIEMTELPSQSLPDAALPQTPQPPAPAPAAPAAPAQAASMGDELRVMAALHGIKADLGEPIEVQRAGAGVVVTVSGLTENRRGQIRAALASIPATQLRFEDVRGRESRAPMPPRSLSPRTAAPVDRINPLIADLQARLGGDLSASDLTDRVIDATDRAAERAYALRALARRFPAEAASQLSRSDADTLRGLILDHTGALATATQEIRRLLAPVLPGSVPAQPVPAAAVWQAVAEALPAAVERLDRTLNGATDAGDARKAQLAESIATLDRQNAALQSAIQSMVRP